MKKERFYFFDLFRRIFVLSFFSVFLFSGFSVEKFWWNQPRPASVKNSVFPKSAGNGEKSFFFWQEVDGKNRNIWLSARAVDSSGTWSDFPRFAGPFEYAGSEIPDIYSAAMTKNGTVAVAVQASGSKLNV